MKYLFSNPVFRILHLSLLFSVSMVLARVIYMGQSYFMFMLWNLFLAYIPFLVSSLFIDRPMLIDKKFLFIPLALLWLVFIPNTFYMITDLFHLNEPHAMPLWFDTLLIVSFSWNGLLLGIISVQQMESVMRIFLGKYTAAIFLYPVFFLNALGVFIGRFLRYNSWDVITDPLGLVKDIVILVLHPFHFVSAWGMVGGFSTFLLLCYLFLQSWRKHSF